MAKAKATSLRAVAAALGQGGRILVASHRNPDGDAIGCTVAAALALQQLGAEVWAYNPDPVPQRFWFLQGADQISDRLPEGGVDATLLLDCSSWAMFADGEPGAASWGTLIVVDHHLTAQRFGDVVLRDAKAAAAAVLLFKICRTLQLTLTLPIAEALFAAIMSDTGSFRYQNANPEALRVAAQLIAAGVDPWRIASRLYEDKQLCELQLLQRVLQTIHLSEDGRTAALTVTPRMLSETGCTPDMVDGLINYARGVNGVEVAVLLRPGPSGLRVSFRSRGKVDVSQIASLLGGGGHRNAAGCLVQDPLEEVRERIFAEVTRLLRPLPAARSAAPPPPELHSQAARQRR